MSADAGADPSAHARAQGIGIEAGDILAEKYEVERIVGSGGMGVVVAARHIHLDERVAIKFLRPEALANAEAVARFQQEARVAVKIKSEHVARVIDVGQLANGAPYLVMEYLEGLDLSQWLKDFGPLDVEQAVEFVLHACEALAEAHAGGIIHRDLKPANLFAVRQADGLLSVKVLDFGISKLSTIGSMAAPSMTHTTAVLGSPQYMSPEQMQSSKSVDSRTDIWSLGIILYELLAGFAPYTAETMPELVLAIVREPFTPLRQARRGVPWGVDRAVTRALEKDRAIRFQTVADFAVALRDFAPPNAHPVIERTVRIVEASGARVTRDAVASTPPPPEVLVEDDASSDLTARNPAPITATIGNWGRTDTAERAHSRRRARRAILLGAAFVALAIGAGGYGWRYMAAHRQQAAAAAPPRDVQQANLATWASPEGMASIAPPLVSATATPTSTLTPVAPSLGSLDAGVSIGTDAGASAPVSSAGKRGAGPAAGPFPLPASGSGKRRPSVAPAAHAPAAAPAPNCTPPFVYDADGHKQYKPECI